MEVVNCLQIGTFNRPFIATHHGIKLETVVGDEDELIKKLKDTFFKSAADDFRFCISFSKCDFYSIAHTFYPNFNMMKPRPVIEVFEEKGVFCINRDDVINDKNYFCLAEG